MLVRFWGTRGSLPVALTTPDVQQEARRGAGPGGGPRARHAGSGAGLRRARARLSRVPHVRRQLVVRGARDGRRRVRRVRPRQRRARLRQPRARHPRAIGASLPRLHVPRALGPHHGLSVLHARLRPGQRRPHLRLPRVLEEAFRRQHAAPSFPGGLLADGRAASSSCDSSPGRDYEIAGLCGSGPSCSCTRAIRTAIGSSSDGKAVVYSTDSEHKLDDPRRRRASSTSSRGADLVIFDAMYSLADAISVKEDWGHSSNIVGVELCQMARAKHLCMFHHEPIFDDEQARRGAAGGAAPRRDHARRPPPRDLGGLGRPGDRRLKSPSAGESTWRCPRPATGRSIEAHWSEHPWARASAGPARPAPRPRPAARWPSSCAPRARAEAAARRCAWPSSTRYQFRAPRERVSAPAVIVDVDEASLARYGQWPWPRTLLARLSS